MMQFDYSTRPFDGRVNIWRRESDLHAWELVNVVDTPQDAWAWIAGERNRPVTREAA